MVVVEVVVVVVKGDVERYEVVRSGEEKLNRRSGWVGESSSFPGRR
jgi:hypothetical protein